MPELTPESAQQLLREWYANRATSAVDMRENFTPAPDPDASYRVVYEAAFEPSLDQARIEIWVTDTGDVAIGFETWRRVASRLAVGSGSKRFVGGHEPIRLTSAGLMAILDLVASGGVAVSATLFPGIGLLAATPIVAPGTRAKLRASGYGPVEWLREGTISLALDLAQVLRFQPW
jgi:hypothetical protein